MRSSIVCIEACNLALRLAHPSYELFRVRNSFLRLLFRSGSLLNRTDAPLHNAQLISIYLLSDLLVWVLVRRVSLALVALMRALIALQVFGLLELEVDV